MLVVVAIMGTGRLDSGPRIIRPPSTSGDAGMEGPFGEDVRDLRSVGEDLEAALARADARCGS